MASTQETVSDKCIECKLCQTECVFLQRCGKPKTISDTYNPDEKAHSDMPFECSLCALCASVCPVGINPALMFLDMRRETVKRGCGDYPEHSVIIDYERRGTSKRYSYYALPEGCDTVFFPGCTLPGTRPDKVIKLFEYLRGTIPSLGIVLDCCAKPSHDLGRAGYFLAMFDEMKAYLTEHGVRRVLVGCPNCHKIFREYGGDLAVTTVYEILAENGLPITPGVSATVTLHDPCAVRFEKPIHEAARNLIAKKGLTVEEMPHHGENTLCCGEGGSVGFLFPEFSEKWRSIRKEEAKGRRIITYCAGCASTLGSVAPTSHILDLIFDPEATLQGKVKVSRAPFTYWNRIRLKQYFRKSIRAVNSRDRTFTAEGTAGNSITSPAMKV